MIFVGLDLSLTATGWAVIREGKDPLTGILRGSKRRGVERLLHLQDQLINVLPEGPLVISVEDYSMGSKGKTFHIGEWGGVAKLTLLQRGNCAVLLASPSSLKQFITGKGNSPKPVVIAHVNKTCATSITNDNEADALTLALMSRYWYRRLPVVPHHMTAMRKVNPCFPIPFRPQEVKTRTRS
jgi:Holliday junction resolvasome RuvABC endonuclease subunit